jgi:cell division septum initiation protein DivIVA
MANGVTELLDELHNLVEEAFGIPLSSDKCILERERVLGLIEEIKNQLPVEMSEAKRLVSRRAEFIAKAKAEADDMRKAAEDRARKLIEEQTVVKAAQYHANEILEAAESRSKAMKKAAYEYADDAMRRTEGAISEALEEVRQSRTKFRSAAASDKMSDEAE